MPCYSVKRIELSFDGNRFAIHPDDFYLGRVGAAGSTACVAAILSIANGLPPNLAIIGDVFLKSCACVVHCMWILVLIDCYLFLGRQGILRTTTVTGEGWVCGLTQTTIYRGGVKNHAPIIIIMITVAADSCPVYNSRCIIAFYHHPKHVIDPPIQHMCGREVWVSPHRV